MIPDGQITELGLAAIGLHETFLSFVTAGFTEDQAMYLVGQFLREIARGGMTGDS